MQFDFPASDDEKQLVKDAIEKLRDSLAKSADLAESLISLLNDNFLAIDKEYKKELSKEYDKIGAAMWQTNIALHKMLQHKERIVSKEE